MSVAFEKCPHGYWVDGCHHCTPSAPFVGGAREPHPAGLDAQEPQS